VISKLAPPLLLGLIGAGIQASRAPALHEHEAAEQGLRCIYKLIDLEVLRLGVDALPDLLTAAERMGFAGLNITHPCKQVVIELLHDLSPDARALNAVNTVLLHDGRRIGHNTDWYGFAENFRRGLPDVSLQHIVQVGAGGAGSAVAHAALTLGAVQLTIIDIDAGKARAVADSLCRRFGEGRAISATDAAAALTNADGLINTTPIGMANYPGLPVPQDLLRPELWVAEIVYFPLETELLRVARARGCRTLNGGGMAVLQAVEAFRLFTGITPDTERMLRYFAAMNA
jgi:shikimate dehydrogenase